MSQGAEFQAKVSALKDLGVGEFSHLNGSLKDHLIGTYQLLKNWGCSSVVCDAGLYHAVYGTQPMKALGLPHKPYRESDRPAIQSVIGKKVEALVYLYAACDRDFFYPTIGTGREIYRDRFTAIKYELNKETLATLLELTLANELEIVLSDSALTEKHRSWITNFLSRCSGLVSETVFRQSCRLLKG